MKLVWGFLLPAVLTVAATMAVACSSGTEDNLPPTPTVAPTAAATNTPSGPQPSPTATSATGNSGDPTNGQALFASQGCSGCHSTGSDKILGPGLHDMAGQAAQYKPELTVDQYIEESIRTPSAFIVPGYIDNLMPKTFGSNLTDQQIKDLIAYLKTL